MPHLISSTATSLLCTSNDAHVDLKLRRVSRNYLSISRLLPERKAEAPQRRGFP